MPVATTTEHILATLRSYIDDDTNIEVVKTWEREAAPSTTTKALAFVFPMIDEYGTLAFEAGRGQDVQSMQVGIFCSFAIASVDTTGAGSAATQYATFKERIERRLDAMNEALRINPATDTTTVGGYTVTVRGADIVTTTGFVDDNEQNKGAFTTLIRVYYLRSL